MSEENIFAAMLREHAHKMDMECAPEESDFWAAADHIYLLERQLYAANSRIEELEQKLRTTSLEALAISDTNNEMAVRIAELQAEVQQLDQSAREARGAAYAWETRDEASQARLSEAVKVLEGLLDVTESDNTPNDIIRFSRSRIQAFITTLGGET